MYCTNCGEKNKISAVYCKKCGKSLNGDNSGLKEVSASKEPTYVGLGGWLALVGFGLLATPVVHTKSMFEYFDYFTKSYDIPGFLGLLQFEFLMAIVIIIISFYLIYLYFKKRRDFPKLYIYFQAGCVIYVVVDYLLFASLNVTSSEYKKIIDDALSQQSGEIMRSIIGAIIWINYMRKSVRVKSTFIN